MLKPEERRSTAAKLAAPPTWGPSRSRRNRKKLSSQWLRQRVGTRERTWVAKRIKIPKRRVSMALFACWDAITVVQHSVDTSNLLQLSLKKLSHRKTLFRRRLRTETRVSLQMRSCRRSARSSSASAQWQLLLKPGSVASIHQKTFQLCSFSSFCYLESLRECFKMRSNPAARVATPVMLLEEFHVCWLIFDFFILVFGFQ